MKSLWSDTTVDNLADSPLQLRVYSSRLLGQEPDLVLHGGGNTSVKITEKNLLGDDEEILYVKGSGWDLGDIEAQGFAPVRLNILRHMDNVGSDLCSKLIYWIKRPEKAHLTGLNT